MTTYLSIDGYKQTVHEACLDAVRKLAAEAASCLRAARVPLGALLQEHVAQQPGSDATQGLRQGCRRPTGDPLSQPQ